MTHRPLPARITALVVLAVALSGCAAGDGSSAASGGAADGGTTGDGCPTSQPDPLRAGEQRLVTIETELGAMEVAVDADLSPIAAGNFVALASCGYYDGVVFHRVVPGFVIQGGDPTGTGTGGPGYTIQDEPVTTAYRRGTVAMARSRQPNSQGSQFFIVLDDAAATSLASANTYAIIGEVTDGMETADAIADAADGVELPDDPVEMTDVSVATP